MLISYSYVFPTISIAGVVWKGRIMVRHMYTISDTRNGLCVTEFLLMSSHVCFQGLKVNIFGDPAVYPTVTLPLICLFDV